MLLALFATTEAGKKAAREVGPGDFASSIPELRAVCVFGKNTKRTGMEAANRDGFMRKRYVCMLTGMNYDCPKYVAAYKDGGRTGLMKNLGRFERTEGDVTSDIGQPKTFDNVRVYDKKVNDGWSGGPFAVDAQYNPGSFPFARGTDYINCDDAEVEWSFTRSTSSAKKHLRGVERYLELETGVAERLPTRITNPDYDIISKWFPGGKPGLFGRRIEAEE